MKGAKEFENSQYACCDVGFPGSQLWQGQVTKGETFSQYLPVPAAVEVPHRKQNYANTMFFWKNILLKNAEDCS